MISWNKKVCLTLKLKPRPNPALETDLEEGQVLVLQGVGDFQVFQDHGAVGVHSHHVLIVVFLSSQQGQLVTHSLTH